MSTTYQKQVKSVEEWFIFFHPCHIGCDDYPARCIHQTLLFNSTAQKFGLYKPSCSDCLRLFQGLKNLKADVTLEMKPVIDAFSQFEHPAYLHMGYLHRVTAVERPIAELFVMMKQKASFRTLIIYFD